MSRFKESEEAWDVQGAVPWQNLNVPASPPAAMTEEQQKEQFSVTYVRAVTTAARVNLYHP